FLTRPATTCASTLSLHDALPIFGRLAALFGRLDDVLGVIETGAIEGARLDRHQQLHRRQWPAGRCLVVLGKRVAAHLGDHVAVEDRKSTRLNSSHVKTSYAVFRL